MISTDITGNDGHVSHGLRLRLALFILFAGAVLGIVIYDTIRDGVSFILSLGGISIGMLFGFILSRIYKIYWHEDSQKVIFKMDILGGILLVLYILFELYRESIVSEFIHGSIVVTLSVAIVAGMSIGRVLGIRRKIRKVVEENV